VPQCRNRERLVESTGNLHGFNVCGFCNYTLRWAIKKKNVNLCFCHHLMVFLQPRLRNSRESPSALPSFGGPFKKWCHPKIGWLIWWVGTKKINLLIRVWGIGGTMWKPIKTTRQGKKGPVTITHNGVFRPSITLKQTLQSISFNSFHRLFLSAGRDSSTDTLMSTVFLNVAFGVSENSGITTKFPTRIKYVQATKEEPWCPSN